MKFFISRYSEQKVAENPLWLIVLSDIMTNLMLFFLILYVFSLQGVSAEAFLDGFDKEKQKMKEKKAEEVINKFKEKDVAEKLREELEKAGLKDMADVSMTDKLIRVNISSPVLFKSASAELGTGSVQILAAVGKVLEKLDKNDIIIEGHTDNVPVKSGEYSSNWEISAARANAVVDHLAARFSIPQERLISAAYGEHRPVAPNDTPAGRAKNRRIEILVVRT